jgi:L-serine dehydratase
MSLSVFDLFKIGIGPSSSHTVGPMRAACRFVQSLTDQHFLARVGRVLIDLYGSLALTGHGHATDKAVLLGLCGERPDTVEIDLIEPLVTGIRTRQMLHLAGQKSIPFRESDDLIFHKSETLPRHPNGMRFTAFDESGSPLLVAVYYSVGGGFVVREGEEECHGGAVSLPYEFASAAELLAIGRRTGLSIAEIVRANERVWRSPEEIDSGLDRLWQTMEQCLERGCRAEGVLPGGLHVQRRANTLFRNLNARPDTTDPLALQRNDLSRFNRDPRILL